MTAIASQPATAHAPVALHSAHPAHASLSEAHDSLAFGAVLDSMPGGNAKPKPSSREDETPGESPRRERPQTQQIANPSFINASLPASLTVATTTIANGDVAKTPGPAAGATAHTPASGAAAAPRAANVAQAGSSLAARLVGERSFHASVAAPSLATAVTIGATSSAVELSAAATGVLDALEASSPTETATMPRSSQATAPSPPANPTPPPELNASHPDRAPAAASGPVPSSTGRIRGERQTDAATSSRTAAPAAERSAPTPHANGEADRSKSDSSGSAGLLSNGGSNAPLSSPAQAFPAAQQPLNAAFADLQSRLADAARGPGAARVTETPAASPGPSAAPVREIDVDLSPGGLEDVSMTMRLAGDRLSLVIRAGSSQTTGAIEGARDAIAERLAAIGQPLGSLIIQQTGSTTDATNAGDASSGGSRGEGRTRGQHGDQGDPRGARRGSSGF